tara:strand:+ start:137 stop:274 length:138 start_codon:yes stop_codon:yes gene_type:complete
MKFAKVLVTPVNSKVSSCQLAEPEVPPEPALDPELANCSTPGKSQ